MPQRRHVAGEIVFEPFDTRKVYQVRDPALLLYTSVFILPMCTGPQGLKLQDFAGTHVGCVTSGANLLP